MVVVLLDDVGVDKVAAYGAHPSPPATPQLDALAARGMRFDAAYAEPMCSPTRAALLTGRLPHRTGIGGLVEGHRPDPALSPDEVLLPALLGRAGYASALAGKWHLGKWSDPATGPDHPRRAGFGWAGGSYENLRAHETPDPVRPDRRGYAHWEKTVNGVPTWVDQYATSAVVDDAIAQAGSMPRPFFLYVALNAAHEPLHTPPPSLTPSLRGAPPVGPIAQVNAAVEAADTELGRLFAALPPDTVVFVLGDNGTDDFGVAPPWDPRQSKGSLLEGGVHIPLVVAGPGVAHGVATQLVHVVDVFATIAAMGGAGAPPAPIDGVSLQGILADPAAPAVREVVLAEKFSPNGPPPYASRTRMARDARYKLVVVEGPQPAERFYDVGRSPQDPRPTPPQAMTAEARAARARLRAALEAATLVSAGTRPR